MPEVSENATADLAAIAVTVAAVTWFQIDLTGVQQWAATGTASLSSVVVAIAAFRLVDKLRTVRNRR